MNIHGNKYWGQIGFGSQCDFLQNAFKGIFLRQCFFVIETFKMKKNPVLFLQMDLHLR